MLDGDFVHLHVHTEYSLLDGCIRIKKYIQELEKRKASAAAITDHDALHGLAEFYLAAKAANIKPILGYEANVLAWSKNCTTKLTHINFIAENNAGYKNLLKICSIANIQGIKRGFDEAPVLEWNDIAPYTEGLICTTSCMHGELSSLLSKNFNNDALDYLTFLKTTFGDKNVFVELINNGLPQQQKLIPQLVDIASLSSLPTVATGDVHFLHPYQSETHLNLLAIKHKLQSHQVRGIQTNYDFHLSTAAEMSERMKGYEESLTNTKVIADRCNVSINTKEFFMPKYESEGETTEECLAKMSKAGLVERKKEIQGYLKENFSNEIWQDYENRLEYELSVINKMNFGGYFLIVQDFINWAKNRGIPVGPGRGSAAGSVVTYALRITDIDPIRFNLLFERFLNPERISMPDIDTDFCMDRRAEVLDYVYERYGKRNVSQIVTFGRLMARNAIKSVARISGWNFNESNDLAKLIPEAPGTTLDQAITEELKLKERVENDERTQLVWNSALEIEGNLNSLGIHAAGVIISDVPLDERCPLMETEGQILTQFEYKYAEKVGLIKFDFLGLKTLTVIQKAVDLIHKRFDPNFDISTIELEDPNVYKMISTAHVTGIFQLESSGMRKLISDLQPTCFMDIVAVLALFRPGPLGSGMVQDFVNRKHGKEVATNELPELDSILKDTYGVIVYQEQVQKIAAQLANYTLGEADLLRRAMGKKDKNEMAKQRERFVNGAQSNGYDAVKMGELFDLMAKFAEYGFNKSHTVAYGLVSYQTAFLKTYYALEFLCALMSCDMDDTDKIVTYVQDCKRMKISVLPPCINHSDYEFIPDGKSSIRYGLGAIKGLGKGIADQIVANRKELGEFKSVPEFIARLDARRLNKKIMESLARSGAFDALHKSRSEIVANSDHWLRSIAKEMDCEDQSSVSIFDFGSSNSSQKDYARFSAVARLKATDTWSLIEKLQHEFATLGFYFSGHPVDLVREDVLKLSSSLISNLGNLLESPDTPDYKRKSQTICGMIVAIFEKKTKDNDPFCVFKVEDFTGTVEATLFPKQYAILKTKFKTGDFVWIDCKLKQGFELGQVRAICDSIGYLTERRNKQIKKLKLVTTPKFLDKPDNVQKLQNILSQFKGNIPVLLEIEVPDKKMRLKAAMGNHLVNVSDEFLQLCDAMWPSGFVRVERIYGQEFR